LGVLLGHRQKIIRAVATLRADDIRNEPTIAVHAAAERRQLTVMFCDLVGSAALSAPRPGGYENRFRFLPPSRDTGGEKPPGVSSPNIWATVF
jgi:hypothetical protein